PHAGQLRHRHRPVHVGVAHQGEQRIDAFRLERLRQDVLYLELAHECPLIPARRGKSVSARIGRRATAAGLPTVTPPEAAAPPPPRNARAARSFTLTPLNAVLSSPPAAENLFRPGLEGAPQQPPSRQFRRRRPPRRRRGSTLHSGLRTGLLHGALIRIVRRPV